MALWTAALPAALLIARPGNSASFHDLHTAQCFLLALWPSVTVLVHTSVLNFRFFCHSPATHMFHFCQTRHVHLQMRGLVQHDGDFPLPESSPHLCKTCPSWMSWHCWQGQNWMHTVVVHLCQGSKQQDLELMKVFEKWQYLYGQGILNRAHSKPKMWQLHYLLQWYYAVCDPDVDVQPTCWVGW